VHKRESRLLPQTLVADKDLRPNVRSLTQTPTDPLMDANPYAPPAANVADREPDSPGLKRRSLWLMIVLTIATLGIYYPVWYIRRRPGLNRLDSPRKLALWPFGLVIAWSVLVFVVGLLTGERSEIEVLGAGLALVLRLGQVAVAILMIIQSFKIKDIIQDHATRADSSGLFVEHVKLSGLMTFFFSIFYLQWAINRYVVQPQELRAAGLDQAR
jgi:hypothetical protein